MWRLMSASVPRFPDRLLCEAVRVFEEFHGEAPVRTEELEALRASDLPLEARVVQRARRLAACEPLERSLAGLGSAIRLAVGIGAALAVISGAAAASGALGFGREEEINVSVVVGALLVVQTILLVLWLASSTILGRTKSASSLGSGLVAIARRLFLRSNTDAPAVAASSAFAEVVTRSSIGKWTFGAISNGLWLAFNLTVLCTCVFLLSTRHYVFVWETTLLSDASFERIVHAASALPAALGFDVPGDRVLADSRWGSGSTPGDEARLAWSGFLLGSIVAYGIVPRAFFFLMSLGLARAAKSRYRLDLTRTGFARLRTQLLPSSKPIGIVDPDRGDAPRPAPKPKAEAGERPLGPPAWVGIEIDAPQSGWPPSIGRQRPTDLGFVDDGKDRHRVLEALARERTEPSTLVVACALTTTPDRGIRAFLEELRSSVSTPLVLVLSEGQRLRSRTDAQGVQERVAHWRRMAEQAGVLTERVVEVDLEHRSRDADSPLHAWLGAEDASSSKDDSPRGISCAFDQVRVHAARWKNSPPLEVQHALHREIAACFGADAPSSLGKLLHMPDANQVGDFARDLTTGAGGGLEKSARRTLDLLPPRLRQSPRWIATGAVTGSLACLAAVAAAGPIALAALPSWTIVGGAIGGLVRALRKDEAQSVEEADESEHGWADAVRSATLTTLLFELSGEGEERITRLLDATFAEEEELTHDALDAWLRGVRHRFDLARAGESA